MEQIECFGKINRILRVGPRRQDGFHEILTVFQSISLHDSLTLELTEQSGILLTVSDPSVPSNKENLAWKACEAFLNKIDYSGGASIHIEKGIPSGGGLGGGSSDAAGTLLLLNKMLDNPLSRNELKELARDLGSDVPFFLVGGSAVGTGRGEQVEPLPDSAPFSFLAVFPDIPFSTKKMYSLLDRDENYPAPKQMSTREIQALLAQQSDGLENSFDRIVSKMSAQVADVMQGIRKEGFPVMLSGSGSTFLIFEGRYLLEKISNTLPAGWQSMKLRSMTRREALGEFVF
jgi:4-diphosphocytidyl-2-C-methyl-D-erythritol kinase